MSCRPILRDVPQQTQSDTSGTTRHLLPNGEPRPADVEMARVLKTAPVQHGLDAAERRASPTGSMARCTTSSSRWPITSS